MFLKCSDTCIHVADKSEKMSRSSHLTKSAFSPSSSPAQFSEPFLLLSWSTIVRFISDLNPLMSFTPLIILHGENEWKYF